MREGAGSNLETRQRGYLETLQRSSRFTFLAGIFVSTGINLITAAFFVQREAASARPPWSHLGGVFCGLLFIIAAKIGLDLAINYDVLLQHAKEEVRERQASGLKLPEDENPFHLKVQFEQLVKEAGLLRRERVMWLLAAISVLILLLKIGADLRVGFDPMFHTVTDMLQRRPYFR